MQTNLATATRSNALPVVPTPLDPAKLTPRQLIDFYSDPKTGLVDTRGLVEFIKGTAGSNAERAAATYTAIAKELSSPDRSPLELARFRQDVALIQGGVGFVNGQTTTASNQDAAVDPSDEQRRFQTFGQGAVSLYDGVIRDGYHKTADANSKNFVNQIDDLVLKGAPIAEIEATSKQAFEARQVLRAETQEKLTPGGKRISQAIETPRSFDTQYSYTENKLAASGKATSPENVYRKIAESSGSSRASMDMLAKGSKFLGGAGVVIGAATAGEAIYSAPPEARAKVSAEQTGAIALGAGGSILGGLAGAATVTLLVSNPVGWAVLGAGAVGSIALGYAGSEFGEKLGGKIYDWFKS
jgi:hypothetical protein